MLLTTYRCRVWLYRLGKCGARFHSIQGTCVVEPVMLEVRCNQLHTRVRPSITRANASHTHPSKAINCHVPLSLSSPLEKAHVRTTINNQSLTPQALKIIFNCTPLSCVQVTRTRPQRLSARLEPNAAHMSRCPTYRRRCFNHRKSRTFRCPTE